MRKAEIEYKADRVMDALGALFYEQYRGTPVGMIKMQVDLINESIEAMYADLEEFDNANNQSD